VSALLGQTGGFEGLGPPVEGPEANRTALPERPYVGSLALNLPLAPPQPSMHAGENDNVIACLDELLALPPAPVQTTNWSRVAASTPSIP